MKTSIVAVKPAVYASFSARSAILGKLAEVSGSSLKCCYTSCTRCAPSRIVPNNSMKH